MIDLDGGGVTWEKLAEDVELPRIDYGRRNTRPYRYAYCPRSADAWFDQLVKVDVDDGDAGGLVGAGLPPRRADLRARAGRRRRGRGRGPVGGARRGRGPLVPAGAGRPQLRGAGPRRSAAPHPVRVPRAVPALRATAPPSQRPDGRLPRHAVGTLRRGPQRPDRPRVQRRPPVHRGGGLLRPADLPAPGQVLLRRRPRRSAGTR